MPTPQFKSLKRAYGFDEVAIVPGDVTINPEQTNIDFKIGDITFKIPLVAAAMDAVTDGRVKIIPERYAWIIRLNPLTHLFELSRYPIYHGQLPPAHVLVGSLVVATVTLLAGWLLFHRLARGFYVHL